MENNEQTIEKKDPYAYQKPIQLVMNVIILVLVAILLVRIFFLSSVTVQQTSMYPTFNDGDKVLVNKLAKVQRGDVVVFFDKDVNMPKFTMTFSFLSGDAKLLIKRVVATEGDEIWLERVGFGTYQLRIKIAQTGEIIDETYYIAPDGNEVVLADLTNQTAGVLWGKVGS